MKKYSFFSLFVLTHVGFIFLHIHKHMKFIKQSFKKQKYEKQLVELAHKKQNLTNQIYVHQNRTEIKEFAHSEGFKTVQLKRVKRIDHDA